MTRGDVKTSAIIRPIPTYRSLFSHCRSPVGNPSCIERACIRQTRHELIRAFLRSGERGSNWRTPTSASYRRGSATSEFQCVKTHTSAPDVGPERENYRPIGAHYFKINATSGRALYSRPVHVGTFRYRNIISEYNDARSCWALHLATSIF